MSRQRAYLKRLKRVGISHLKEGLDSVEPGSVAIQCWACPREGVNLPPEWTDVADEKQYLYQLFIGLDANFHLKNRLRRRNHLKKDQPLYDGLGYQVPQKVYFDYLKKCVTEDDISTCIAFAALMEKETKLSDVFPSSSDVSPSPSIDVILPIWHGNVHQAVCKTWNLLKYQHGAGLSDGEAPEWLWAVMNLVVMQMKEMQLEVCHDALEDKADHHNFGKNIGMGHLLDWCLKLALEERQVQDKAFKGIDVTLKDELRADWMGMMDASSKDQMQPNPYMARLKKQVTVSEAEVKLKLRQEELAVLMCLVTASDKRLVGRNDLQLTLNLSQLYTITN
ncbi:hypothetical protein EV421DRAFT_1914722 [Armillaria borealis]|uniref:CxC2-like cysteine cluster KDZ transposase-associated domain-containing protein n=1 Tax=Armillaria borealis TaxID=47425 RepID=A0AA39M550_9AGAR|nr:hypothetical protein EV421DRAFT_1914722 [Armillaria borealis]